MSGHMVLRALACFCPLGSISTIQFGTWLQRLDFGYPITLYSYPRQSNNLYCFLTSFTLLPLFQQTVLYCIITNFLNVHTLNFSILFCSNNFLSCLFTFTSYLRASLNYNYNHPLPKPLCPTSSNAVSFFNWKFFFINSTVWLWVYNRKVKTNNHLHNVTLCLGEGDGSPLQYSRLENPMDGGVW